MDKRGLHNLTPRSSTKKQSCRVEGNLLEYPTFYFGDRSRPSKMSFVFEGEIDGQPIHRKITVGNHDGLPGALAQDCLVALLMLRDESREIHFYVREVTRLVFGNDRTMRRRQLVKQNLKLLAKTMIEFEDSFYNAEKREYVTTNIQPLFYGARIYEHRAGKNRMDARKHNVFRLSDLFENNINARYFNWVYFESYRKLKSGLSRRLFLYLTKKSNGGRRREFSITVEKLYPRLPITSKRPSERFECLDRAAKDLSKVGIARRYDNKGIVTFTFPDRLREAVEAPRVDTKALEDLVVRFYQGLDRKIVSDRRRREGVEVLRAIQGEAAVGAERLGQIIQWVLDRRDTKFKNLHSIRVLTKAWDQALSAIQRDEKKVAVAKKATEEAELQKKLTQERDDALVKLRAKFSNEDLAGIRNEAERRLREDRSFAFHLGRLTLIRDQERRAREEESVLRAIEAIIMREREEVAARPTEGA